MNDALPIDATLIVVDVQQVFDDPRWGSRNNPEAEDNVALLLQAWRAGGRPVIHVQHHNEAAGSRFHPDSPAVAPKPQAEPLPGEPVLFKNVNSASSART